MMVEVGVTKQLIRQYLLDDATLRAAVQGKVYASHLASSDAQTVLQGTPIVVIDYAGGNARYFGDLENVTIECYVYSKRSSAQCAEIYDQVFMRLQMARVAVTGLDLTGTTRELDRPAEGYNEAIAAYFLRGRWTLIAV
ncbi:MAG: hypothetical protein KGS10_05505 [Chloroflexi bacterium]|nr:hypothetical protein [Chloroflexota bacterium]